MLHLLFHATIFSAQVVLNYGVVLLNVILTFKKLALSDSEDLYNGISYREDDCVQCCSTNSIKDGVTVNLQV